MKKLFSGIVLIVAVIALAAFITLAIGVWPVTAELHRRTDRALDTANGAVDRAEPVVFAVRKAILAAQDELAAAKPPEQAAPLAPVPKMLLRSALKDSPERVESATRASEMMGDLLAAANAALGTLHDTPGVPPLDTRELSAFQEKVKSSAESLRKVNAILGSTKPNDPIAAEDTRTIENALGTARTVTNEALAEIVVLRVQIEILREQVHSRLTLACWSIFALSLMGALGQIALIRWCVGCLRKQGAMGASSDD